jgi:hypothetical protein
MDDTITDIISILMPLSFILKALFDASRAFYDFADLASFLYAVEN